MHAKGSERVKEYPNCPSTAARRTRPTFHRTGAHSGTLPYYRPLTTRTENRTLLALPHRADRPEQDVTSAKLPTTHSQKAPAKPLENKPTNSPPPRKPEGHHGPSPAGKRSAPIYRQNKRPDDREEGPQTQNIRLPYLSIERKEDGTNNANRQCPP